MVTKKSNHDNFETVGSFVARLVLRRSWREPDRSFLPWPPDAFAVAMTILRESGAYVNVLSNWPPAELKSAPLAAVKLAKGQHKRVKKGWVERIKDLGRNTWRLNLHKELAPSAVAGWWKTIWKYRDKSLLDVREKLDIWQALIQVAAAADEASHGFGFPPKQRKRRRLTKSENYALLKSLDYLQLERDGAPPDHDRPARNGRSDPARRGSVQPTGSSTLCSPKINRSLAIVLPKMTTPQNGITVRSLSHNLALLPGTEVHTTWLEAYLPAPAFDPHSHSDTQSTESREASPCRRLEHGMNLLLVPWPLEVLPAQFRAIDAETARVENMPDKIGLFSFEPDKVGREPISKFGRICRRAKKMVGRIDGVVFPELELDPGSFAFIRRRLEEEDVGFLISGIFDNTGAKPVNAAKVWMRVGIEGSARPPKFFSYESVQNKHHRWVLEGNQIRRYGLGATLDPGKKWFEYCAVTDRRLQFVVLDPFISMTVLICEDLARPDPVADVIRAVGPGLVIALLLDGPQLRSRWSARYATVLADDPGCSVLTLTGLGMAKLSRVDSHSPPSRVVALWKEADGNIEEIELPINADALVLCLDKRNETQWTADGRSDEGVTGRLVLGGVHAVECHDPKAKRPESLDDAQPESCSIDVDSVNSAEAHMLAVFQSLDTTDRGKLFRKIRKSPVIGQSIKNVLHAYGTNALRTKRSRRRAMRADATVSVKRRKRQVSSS